MKNKATRALILLTKAYQNAQEGPGRKKLHDLMHYVSSGRITAAELDTIIKELESKP